jgi:hypothetical protein
VGMSTHTAVGIIDWLKLGELIMVIQQDKCGKN